MKERGHSYMWNEHLGYVLTCPSNLELASAPVSTSSFPPWPRTRRSWTKSSTSSVSRSAEPVVSTLLLRRHLRCLQRRPHRLLRGRAPPVRLRRCRSPHRDGEARRRGQALRRSHPHRHEEVNFISRT